MPEASVPTSFAELLRRYRVAAGFTQEDLAERAGLSPRGVLYLERGARQPYRDTVRRLAQALALSPPEQETLTNRARVRATSARDAETAQNPAGQALDVSPYELPMPATALLGREQVVAEATALLLREEVRLLTLTGRGGVGKTRLAVQMATRLREHFADGVVFVSLAPVGEASLVLPTIAQALGVIDQGSRPLGVTLAGFLRHKQLLLVLDNFEQVRAAAAEVAKLRAACAGLRVLVTSQAALRVQGERLYRVPRLALPDIRTLPPLEKLARIPAVDLFVQRARATQGEFSLNAANAVAVAMVCVRLEGLPLAIELAAAWVHVLPPAALAARLAQPLGMLTRGARDLPARQQTLRATIAWSYQLLPLEAQVFFRRLAVFAGGITPTSAAAVCWVDEVMDELAVLEGLGALVELHLLHRVDPAADTDPWPEARFSMPDTIREYGREQLAAAGETDVMRQRHMDYYLDLAEQATPHFWRAEQLIWLDRFDEELANLRLALAYCVERGNAGDVVACERGLSVVGRLSLFWLLRSYIHEALLWLEQLLQTPPAAMRTEGRAWALWCAAPLAGVAGDHAQAHAQAEQCVAIFRELGDPWRLAAGLDVLACVRAFHPRPNSTDLAGVRSCREEALALFQQAGDRDGVTPTMIGALYLWTGIAAVQLGDLSGARAELTHSLALVQAAGERFFADLALESLARLARAEGDPVGAHGYLVQALAGAEALGDHYSVTIMHCALGDVAQAAGDRREAHAYYIEALRGVAHLGHVFVCEQALCGLAELALARGDAGHALRLVGAALALAAAAGATPGAEAHTRLERVEAEARQGLTAQEQARALAAGQAMTLTQVLAEELRATDDTAFRL